MNQSASRSHARPQRSVRRILAIAACAALASATSAVRAGEFAVAKNADSVVDSRGLTLDGDIGIYGIGVNNNSFENTAITTVNGWQYTAYWVKNGATNHVALARRPIGTTGWQVADLTDSTFSNGIVDHDAHDVVSLGIDEGNGTIHLAYDLHNDALKYRVSVTGVATSPNSITQAQWAQSLFGTQRSALNSGGSTVSDVTYPHFIRRLDGSLQLTYRTGISGDGSNWLTDYNDTTGAWNTPHQYDDGNVGTYNGAVTSGGVDRNSYINGATYGPSGRLYQSFTWREGATGAANHDVNFVYSDDGGNVWRNNAGTIVGNNTGPQQNRTKFNLNSPGLIVVPLSERQSLMNQQAQAVSGNSAATERFHLMMWHRDSAKTDATYGVYEPTESSYFHYWRDTVGNFHRNKLPGAVGSRPKLFFDANDNAIAIYQLGAFTSAGIYINNGDLVIAAATKASNWADWKIIKTEAGPFVSEAQADARLLALTGTLSVLMQESPADSHTLSATNMRALDYTITLAPATDRSATASGNWSATNNWSGTTIPAGNVNALIGGGRTITLDQSVAAVDNSLVVGTGGNAGTLNVAAGTSLNVGGSVIVGRDGGSVGTYNQTGGSLSSWRFVVGDFFSETSGGGTSTATVSGGSLTTGELQVAASANASSNNSTFTVAGTGNVAVNGEVIIADNGGTGSVVLNGGTMTVLGDVVEGFNGVNSSTLRVAGGTLNMTGNAIAVDNFILDAGRVENLTVNGALPSLNGAGGVITRTDGVTSSLTINAGSFAGSIQNGNGVTSLIKTTTGLLTLSGASTYTGGTSIINGGVLEIANASALGTGAVTVGSGDTNNGGTLRLSGNIAVANAVNGAGRLVAGGGGMATIENLSGDNSISGPVTFSLFGGGYTNIVSTAGNLTLSGNVTALNVTASRGFNFSGAGNVSVDGVISNGSATVFIEKAGAGVLTLSRTDTYTGTTTVNGGRLVVTGSIAGSAITVNTGGTLGGSGTVGGLTLSGGTLAPGSSVGALTSGAATLTTGGYVWELASNTATADKLIAASVTIGAAATFNPSDLSNFALANGTVLTAIASGSAINGVFGNLADNSLVTVGLNTFFADYQGGNGNALTLTAVPEPASLVAVGAVGLLATRRRKRFPSTASR